MKKPIFEGFADVIVERGQLTVVPPKHVVIPPGYEIDIEVHLPSETFPAEKPMATYKVVESNGLKAKLLRWFYPYTSGPK